MAVDLGDTPADLLQELGQVFLLLVLIRVEDALGEIERAASAGGFLLREPPGVHLLAQSGQHDELRVARTGFRGRRFRGDRASRSVPLAERRTARS